MMLHTIVRPGSPAEETRARILAAAKAVYEENGTRGTTTRLVAERAGVNEATLFRHFGNKQALLAAMREASCAVASFDEVLGTLTGDLRADLRLMADSLVARMSDQRAMMCISLAEEARGERGELTAPEWRGPAAIIERLTDTFAGYVRRGLVRGDAHRLAIYFMGMLFSYVLGRKLWNSAVVKADDLDFIVDTFMNGVL
jgi:AcrR family transcriptional regulator